MRKLVFYSLLCAVMVGAYSCKKEESAPPKPSFTVDKTSGLSGATEFTFTVTQVGADAVSLLPYGVENGALGGILISTFTDGVATVKFTYAQVGTFNAVVVANNHSADGKSVKNTISDPTVITITSDQASISDFSFKGSTATTIDQAAGTIDVTVPFGQDATALKAIFTASDFSTVKVGGAAQVSGTTVNNFSGPVVYTVVANNGTATKAYTVNVTVTPVEQDTDIKTFSGDANGKPVAGYVDNAGHNIVIYNVKGTDPADFDSVAVKYELHGKFSALDFNGKHLAQGKLFDLSDPNGITVTVMSEDSANVSQDYQVYSDTIPDLTVSFPGLNPPVSATNNGYVVSLDVLNGTTNDNLPTIVSFDAPAGVIVGAMTIDGNPFVSGDPVDYSDDVKLMVQLTDTNGAVPITFWATYTISVTVVK